MRLELSSQLVNLLGTQPKTPVTTSLSRLPLPIFSGQTTLILLGQTIYCVTITVNNHRETIRPQDIRLETFIDQPYLKLHIKFEGKCLT